MESILEENKEVKDQIDRVAEVAGYLWAKGWAERNGGNITLNITSYVDDSWFSKKAIAGPFKLNMVLPHLKHTIFYAKGTNKRMRDLARKPMENGSIIRITDDCLHYEIIGDLPVEPTSELASHLSIHNDLIGKGSNYKAVVHTHPIELVAMSHHSAFLEKDKLSHILWSMIPETRAFCPKGLGIVPYALPSSQALADLTIATLQDYDVVMWEKHGVVSIAADVMEAFDQIDVLTKSAQIYQVAKNMGFEPEGMSNQRMDELQKAFKL